MKSMCRTSMQLAVLLVATCFTFPGSASEFDAVLDWAGLRAVTFPLDGSVSKVHVGVGQKVSKGAKLVELSMEPINIRIRQHEAELAARKPVLADARRDFDHAQSLYEQTVLSDVELQQARHAYERARAELAAAQARLDYARWQKQQASVSAPFDAWVVQRNVDPGQMLVAEQRANPVLLLARTGLMAARAGLPLSELRSLRTGDSVTVLVGERSFPARVSAIGMQPEGGGGANYMLEALFETGPNDVFRAGQAARVRLR